jgi:phage/plasmid-associated DNA primase
MSTKKKRCDTTLVMDALRKFGLYSDIKKQPQGPLFYVGGVGRNETSLKCVLELLDSPQATSVYVVPAIIREPTKLKNGSFSRKQSDIADAQWLALIAEHDDCPKEDSLKCVADSGLPTPTFQIDSGNKSIHHWWLLKEPITTEEFVVGQKLLAAVLGSDPNISLPTQVVRIPGFVHHKSGNMCKFISVQEEEFTPLPQRYDYQELISLLGTMVPPGYQPKEEAPVDDASTDNTDTTEATTTTSTGKRKTTNEWFSLLSESGRAHVASEMLGHVWQITSGDYPESHNIRLSMVAGLVGYYRDLKKVVDVWEAAAKEYDLVWDKTTKSGMFEWAKELLRGQNDRKDKNSHHPSKNNIGTCIAVAKKLGWNPAKYKAMVAKDPGHLSKMVCAEMFDSGQGWITYNGKCYRKVDTHYEYQDDVDLLSRISQYLDTTPEYAPNSNSNSTNGVLDWLKVKTGTTAKPNPDGYINCLNGVLEVKPKGHRRLIPHDDPESEKYIFFDAPRFVYDPDADREEAYRLLGCLPDPQGRALFMRAMAFPINWDEAAKRHGHSIALFSRGAGSNGKDTNIVMLKRIYGESAVTGIQLTEFQKADKDSSYALSELTKARLNLPSETNCALKIDNLKTLKAVTTGDPIWAEAKFVQGFMCQAKISQMYPTNNEFILNNTREADERRYMALDWPYSYTSNPDKLRLYPDKFKRADRRFLGHGSDDDWVCENVVPGYFNILLEYFEEVCEHGFDDLLEYSRSIVREMGEKINHIRTFAMEIGLQHSGELPAYHKDSITVAALFEDYYKSWCVDNNRAEPSNAYVMQQEILNPKTDYRLVSPTTSSDKTCMTALDLENRLSDMGITTGRPYQAVATACGIARARTLKHCRLQPPEDEVVAATETGAPPTGYGVVN